MEEERVVDPVTGGMKGQKLPQLSCADPLALLELAKIYGFGNKKYERLNYMKGYRWSLAADAMFRHFLLFWSGEDRDQESKLHHMAAAAWHCLTLLTYSLRGLGTDDRYKTPLPPPEEIEKGSNSAEYYQKQWQDWVSRVDPKI